MLLIGLLADVLSANRKLTEELLYRVRTLEASGGAEVPVQARTVAAPTPPAEAQPATDATARTPETVGAGSPRG